MTSTSTVPTQSVPATGTGLQLEWSLLRTACSILPETAKQDALGSLLREPIRWSALFDLADRHGVQPLLSQALSPLENLIPAEPMNALRRLHQANALKAMFLSRELIRVLECLSEIGVDVMPYKGLTLAEMAYGDIGLRQSGDIDLLIHAADLSRIREAVRTLGYTPHAFLSESQERAYLKSGYECAFDTPSARNLLEVHWAIQPRFYAVDLDIEQLFQRAVSVSVAGRSVKSLCAEDLFIVLSLHAAKHLWGRLLWLCDLARVMTRSGLDWKAVASQAAELRAVRIVRVGMLLANRILEARIPDAAHATLPEDSTSAELAKEIEVQIASGAVFHVESFSYFRMIMRLRERKSDRLRFLTRLVLTPGPGEWEAVRLPGALFPLYRLVRLYRLAARLAGF